MVRTVLIVGALGLVAVIATILVIAAMRPDHFRIQRAALIAAPPERIFPLIADFRRWPAWSPWEKKDPAMKRSFAGPDRGVGAAYAWDGDKNVGTGRMEIIEAAAPSRVALKLDF
ncbi:MAG: SRPBCC family protein, partial [Alphaproteobacteria bacterium]